MPKISVIVPVYKVEDTLRRCISSVLSQTFTDFELILVDDGSPDRCPSLCDECSKSDSRIHVIHQTNKGLSEARNAGIDWAFSNSDSEWVTFIDSDDFVNETLLSKLYHLAIDNHVDCSIGGFSFCYSDELVPLKKDCFDCVCSPDDLFGNPAYGNDTICPVSAWCKLYKKSLFQNVRFPAGKRNEDRFTTHRLVFQCKEIAYSTENLYMYFQSKNSITRSKWNPKYLDNIEGCELELEFFEKGSYKKTLKKTCRDYLRILGDQLDMCREMKEYQKEFLFIKKRQKEALGKYGELAGITLWNNPYYFRYQNPFLYRAVIFFQAVLWKIKNLFKKRKQ